MRILIDIGHPAHIHLFKNFAWEMQRKGHGILFTCRDKEFEIYLLEKYGFRYKSFGKKFNSRIGKMFGLVKFDLLEIAEGMKFTPDIFLSHGSIYAAHAAWILRKPHITFEDTFNFEQLRLYKPFTKVILTSDYEHPLTSNKVVRFSGYHELAYLHPEVFIPDEKIKEELKILPNEKYMIIRFVSWQATHDTGMNGFLFENKISAVNEFSKYAKVFITSEKQLPTELIPFKLKIAPEKIHDALAFSNLMFGESATMASESAVLGVPSIFMDNKGRLYTDELEKKYGLVFNYSESKQDQYNAIKKGIEILTKEELNVTFWKEKRDRMLAEKINVTKFLVGFIEKYPKSVNHTINGIAR